MQDQVIQSHIQIGPVLAPALVTTTEASATSALSGCARTPALLPVQAHRHQRTRTSQIPATSQHIRTPQARVGCSEGFRYSSPAALTNHPGNH